MKVLSLLLALWLFPLFMQAQTLTADSFLVSAPRSVLALIDRTSRLDMLDLYAENLPAKVENVYGGQSELTRLTSGFLSIKTSDIGVLTMKIIPQVHDSLLLVVHSVKAGGVSSTLSVYSTHWKPLKISLPQPDFDQYYKIVSEISPMRDAMLRALLAEVPVEITLSETDDTVSFRLSLSGLAEGDRKDAERCLHSVRYSLKDYRFVPVVP